MKTKYFLYAILVFAAFTSCKKEDAAGGLNSVFSFVPDGFKVNFTNFSSGATTYSWNFGDGDTSNARNPIHIFKAKGDYLVTLVASNGSASDSFSDTVSVLGPNIKIDGDLTDWDYVDYTFNYGDGSTDGGTLLGVKTFANATDLFLLLEGTSDMNIAVMDMYIDADNNPATGFNTWLYPAGSGADYLYEGATTWGSLYKHAGAPTDFSWEETSTNAVYFSPVKTVSGKKYVEFSIKRSELGTTKNYVNFGIVEMSEGWAEIGTIPVSKKPGSIFAKIKL